MVSENDKQMMARMASAAAWGLGVYFILIRIIFNIIWFVNIEVSYFISD